MAFNMGMRINALKCSLNQKAYRTWLETRGASPTAFCSRVLARLGEDTGREVAKSPSLQSSPQTLLYRWSCRG